MGRQTVSSPISRRRSRAERGRIGRPRRYAPRHREPPPAHPGHLLSAPNEGHRPGVSTAEAKRIAELEREVKELRRANEILRTASAFFAAAELDRKLK